MSLPFARVLRTLMTSDAACTAALPGGIHPDQIPQESSLPALAYSVSSEPVQSLSGSSSITDIRYATLSLTVIARTATQAEAADKAISDLVKAHREKTTQSGYSVHRLIYSGMNFESEFLSDGDDESYRKLTGTITGFVL